MHALSVGGFRVSGVWFRFPENQNSGRKDAWTPGHPDIGTTWYETTSAALVVFRVSGFRVRVSDFGSRFFGFRVLGSGFRVPGFVFRVSGSGCRIAGFIFGGTEEPAGWGPDGAREVPAFQFAFVASTSSLKGKFRLIAYSVTT